MSSLPAEPGRLADKLKEFHLGVTTELVEKVKVNESWFASI